MNTQPQYIMDAIKAGRQVPQWIADTAKTETEFEEFMALRERAFPKTKPAKK